MVSPVQTLHLNPFRLTRLDAIGTLPALALKGKADIAQGKMAYELFQRVQDGVARGAGGATAATTLGVHRWVRPNPLF